MSAIMKAARRSSGLADEARTPHGHECPPGHSPRWWSAGAAPMKPDRSPAVPNEARTVTSSIGLGKIAHRCEKRTGTAYAATTACRSESIPRSHARIWFVSALRRSAPGVVVRNLCRGHRCASRQRSGIAVSALAGGARFPGACRDWVVWLRPRGTTEDHGVPQFDSGGSHHLQTLRRRAVPRSPRARIRLRPNLSPVWPTYRTMCPGRHSLPVPHLQAAKCLVPHGG